MGICWWGEYSRFEADHKSFQSFNSFHWKLRWWKVWVSSKCDLSSLILRPSVLNLPPPMSFTLYLMDTLPFVGCLVWLRSSWFPIGSRWFLKNNNSGAFSGRKKVDAASKAVHFFSTDPTLPAKQGGTTTCPQWFYFGKNQKGFFSKSRCAFRALTCGHLLMGRLVLQRFPE